MKYYSNSIAKVALHLLFSLSLFTSFSTLLGTEESFTVFFTEADPQKKIEYFEQECKKISFGEVKSQACISKLNIQEQPNRQSELNKVYSFLRALKEIVTVIQKEQLTNEQKVVLIEHLARLHSETLKSRIGLGNLEIACVISIVTSGIVCQLLNEDNFDTKSIKPIIEEMQEQTLPSAEALHHVLSDEFNYSGDKQENFKQIILGILKELYDGNNIAQKTWDVMSPMDASGEYLSKSNSLQSFSEQITKPNKETLIWDLLCAMRLQILCRLEILNRNESKKIHEERNSFKNKIVIFNEQFTENEKFVLMGYSATKINVLEKLASSQLDMRTYISKNGLTILNMIYNRLKSIDAKADNEN